MTPHRMKYLHADSRLKYRQPYNRKGQEMVSVITEDQTKDAWIATSWKQEWEASGPTRVHRHVSDPGEGVIVEDLYKEQCTTLNTLDYELRSYMKKLATDRQRSMRVWQARTDGCQHNCPLHRPPSEANLFEVGPLIRAWLQHRVDNMI